MKLVFATRNQHKINEIRKMLPSSFDLVGLDEIGCFEDIPETSGTILGNAIQKASHVSSRYDCNCFADDTGLIVDALNGAPGVNSARYAGLNANSDDNINKLLHEMVNKEDRKARFMTLICLIIGGIEHNFEGIVEGEILRNRRGAEGFGYDPVFLPKGQKLSFAEMSSEQKNKISHRSIAFTKMLSHLRDLK
ncbi:MAG: non-canonical purine NTP diphosphatase [Bacteroidia bacterium]|nr:non-canonical purine NTP diphosphatase [Bacteroidia bacterium]